MALNIITLVVFIFPAFIGIIKRRKYGILYSLLMTILLTILIADFGNLMNFLATKLPSIDEFCKNVNIVTKYNLALMDEIAIPMLSNIFGEKAKYFLYYSALGVYVILIVLGGIFKKKKKNKDKE